jgi:crotonobetainyl-CoA:carnitine CoA-transferase CaiB-like acyl-CoA transferase
VMWERFCHAMDAPEWLADARFASNRSRSEHRVALNVAISERMAQRPSAHWVSALNAEGVACGPINRVDQAFDDPQVRHLGIAWACVHPQLGAIGLVGQPLHSDRHRAGLRTLAPEAGEHTESILAEAGFTPTEIESLRNEHVI